VTINTLFQPEKPSKILHFQAAFFQTVTPKKKPRDRSKLKERIDHWLNIISKIEEGRYIIQFSQENKIQIAVAKEKGIYGYFSPSKNMTVISSTLKDGDAIGTLFHETRHAIQCKSGFWCDAALSPRDNILMSCAMEADAEAFCVMASYKLKLAGYPEAFEAHKKSPYGDISNRFEKMVTENPASLEDGSAMRAAYDRWFKNPNRVISYAANALKMVHASLIGFSRQYNQKGFMPLTHEIMEGIGELPNGTNYQKAEGRDLVADTYKKLHHPELLEFLEILERGIGMPTTVSNDNKPGKEPKSDKDMRDQLRNIIKTYSPGMMR